MQVRAQSERSTFRANLACAPPELVALGVLCAGASVVLLGLWLFGPQPVKEELIQHVGWAPFTSVGFVAIAVADAIAHRRLGCGRVFIWLGLLLAVVAAWHAYEWSTGAWHRMAYIRVSAWLPLWQALLAASLLVIGCGRRLRSFCGGAS